MKKKILILLLVCLTTVLFTGCGTASNTETPAVPEKQASTETQDPQKAAGNVEKAATAETAKNQETVTKDSEDAKTVKEEKTAKTTPPKTTTPKTTTPKAATPELVKSPESAQKDPEPEKEKVKEDEKQPLAEGEALVSSFAELQAAVADTKITTINLGSDFEITGKLFYEREDDGPAIAIKKGITLTVGGEFIPVGGSIKNDGAIIVKGVFDRGICNLINGGSITVKNGGMCSSGMSTTVNNGEFTVEQGGQLFIERGSEFKNPGVLTNNGSVSVRDGGSLHDEGGSLINNGTLDLSSYFSGEISKITGTGTLNDNR